MGDQLMSFDDAGFVGPLFAECLHRAETPPTACEGQRDCHNSDSHLPRGRGRKRPPVGAMNGPNEREPASLQRNSPLRHGGALGFRGFGRLFPEEKDEAEDDPGEKDQDQGSETNDVSMQGRHLPPSSLARNISSNLTKRRRFARWSSVLGLDARKDYCGEGEAAHQERKPDRGKPRYGDEEQHIGIAERERPSDGGPEAGVVDGVPEGEGPKENGGARAGIRGSEESDAEEHEDGGGFAKEFEGEKALGELADGLGLNVILGGHADHVGESSLIAGE